jgi:hypothetical protein
VWFLVLLCSILSLLFVNKREYAGFVREKKESRRH